ncbi:MAG TPA: hypothetical protein VFD94_02665, partial [Jatrophihabitans sp.]|nr:hypothetical protein [Jatrophihabitans sp.]
MSNTLARFSCDPARGNVPTEAVLPALLSALAELPRSADPAKVLAGLARLCVPLCCDGCAISIVQPDQPGYRLHWPPVGAELDGPVEPG